LAQATAALALSVETGAMELVRERSKREHLERR
jgi:hypothetical protein